MLILTRHEGEWISIGDDIRLQIVRIKGDQVRLGIEAPADVAILRDDAKNKEPRDEAQGS